MKLLKHPAFGVFILFPLGVSLLAAYPPVFFGLLMFVAGGMYARKEF